MKKVKTELPEHKSGQAAEILPHDRPQICLFDFDDKVKQALEEKSYLCKTATLGPLVSVPNFRSGQNHILKLNFEYPPNLHEYDILIFNTAVDSPIEFNAKDHVLTSRNGRLAYGLLCAYPETIFNPRPYTTRILAPTISDLLDKKSIIIVFASATELVEYRTVEISAYSNDVKDVERYSSMGFYSSVPSSQNKAGRKMKVPNPGTKLNSLMAKYLEGSHYEVIFNHPTKWNGQAQEKIKSFLPLLLNNDEEIVSYYHCPENGAILVFPQIAEKTEFLLELLNIYLPEIYPEIFPFHGQFKWLDTGEYPVPGETEIRDRLVAIEAEFQTEKKENEERLSASKAEFWFLRDLISESGDKLVAAVFEYLKFLGVENARSMDNENSDILEEDIQIDFGDKCLVVEIKGLGGTSTDKDCSQISKIRYRRAEERGRFDVYGLYIVNHQRYIPPEKRTNPPFSENQIKDAKLDKRGLLTTFDLYKAYFNILSGLIKKEDVVDALFEVGYIQLEPKNITSLGRVNESYKGGLVGILNLSDNKIKVDDVLFVKKNNIWSSTKITSIMVNDHSVQFASSGEVGVQFSLPVKKGSEIFLRDD